ncbi:MAG: hypothetical protein GY953_42210 [bacterium]|nr:hypothetical protein [bacterium]
MSLTYTPEYIPDDIQALLDDEGQRYTVAGRHWSGIAVWVDGPETELDADSEWTGFSIPTGRVLVVMVGDDKRHAVDVEDLTPLDDEDYCGTCGQVGCAHG